MTHGAPSLSSHESPTPQVSPTSQVSPLASVVLPVKNGGLYLREAVDSILAQTLSNFELILVDDHSTDGGPTTAILNRDSRLSVCNNPGSGVIDAANYGASIARGKFLARMDADDISKPDRLEKQVEFLESNRHIDIVGAKVDIFVDEGEVAEGYRLYEKWINAIITPEDIRRSIFIENPIPNPTMMIRRETFEALGGYRDMGWPEDYDFFLRAYEAGIGIGKVDEVLLRWRDHPARTTRVDGRYSPKSFMKTRAHFLARTVLKNRPAIIWGAGKNGPALCKLLDGEGADITAFIDINPRRIGKEKVGRPVMAPESVHEVGDELIVVCVAARGARGEIREFLNEAGKVEGEDYICAL